MFCTTLQGLLLPAGKRVGLIAFHCHRPETKTMRYRLRTLLIVLTLGPPALWIGSIKYEAWRAEQERLAQPNTVAIDFAFPIIDQQGEPSPQPGLVTGEPVEASRR
jgi:hypothetical protein